MVTFWGDRLHQSVTSFVRMSGQCMIVKATNGSWYSIPMSLLGNNSPTNPLNIYRLLHDPSYIASYISPNNSSEKQPETKDEVQIVNTKTSREAAQIIHTRWLEWKSRLSTLPPTLQGLKNFIPVVTSVSQTPANNKYFHEFIADMEHILNIPQEQDLSGLMKLESCFSIVLSQNASQIEKALQKELKKDNLDVILINNKGRGCKSLANNTRFQVKEAEAMNPKLQWTQQALL